MHALLTRILRAPQSGLSPDAMIAWLPTVGMRVELIGEEVRCEWCRRLTTNGCVYISDGARTGDPIEDARPGWNDQASGWCLRCVRKLGGVPNDDDSAYAAVMAWRLTK